jgi:hypothetical protein
MHKAWGNSVVFVCNSTSNLNIKCYVVRCAEDQERSWGEGGGGAANRQHNEYKNYFVPNKFEIIEPNKGISQQ